MQRLSTIACTFVYVAYERGKREYFQRIVGGRQAFSIPQEGAVHLRLMSKPGACIHCNLPVLTLIIDTYKWSLNIFYRIT